MWSTQADLRLELLLPSEPFFLPSSLPFPSLSFLPLLLFFFLFVSLGEAKSPFAKEKRRECLYLSLPSFPFLPTLPYLRFFCGCVLVVTLPFFSFISTSDHISASRSQLPTRCGQSRSSRHGWGWCARGASRSCLQIANCLFGR